MRLRTAFGKTRPHTTTLLSIGEHNATKQFQCPAGGHTAADKRDGRGLEIKSKAIPSRGECSVAVSVIRFVFEVVGGVNDTDGAGARAHDHRLRRRAAGKKMN